MSNQGGFSEEAFEKYQRLISEQGNVEFSEGETYDFTRCMRPNGTFYGTRGKCKKGSESGAKEPDAPKTAGGKKRRATAEGKAAAKEAIKKAAGGKRSASAARTRLVKEELEKVKEKMRGASFEVQDRLMREAIKKANDRAAAGEGKPKAAAGEKPKRKLATTAETKPAWQEAEKAATEAKIKYRAAERETKGDQSVEARQRRLEAGRALDKAERIAQKAADRYHAAVKRESNAKMTPEQRKEEREWNKFKKQYG